MNIDCSSWLGSSYISDQMAKQKRQTFKQRQAANARMATHSQAFIWTMGQRAAYENGRAACGRKLFENGIRVPRVEVRQNGPWWLGVTCKACRRLCEMTAEQWFQNSLDEAKKLQDVRAKQREKAEKEKAERLAEKHAFVEKYQQDALVALDAYLEGTEYEHMDQVLSAALTLERLRNPQSRGERLWVFGGTKDSHAHDRDMVCRFCRRKIGESELGHDWSDRVFRVSDWQWFGSWMSAEMSLGPVGEEMGLDVKQLFVQPARHTTLCALAYLSETECVEPVPQ